MLSKCVRIVFVGALLAVAACSPVPQTVAGVGGTIMPGPALSAPTVAPASRSSRPDQIYPGVEKYGRTPLNRVQKVAEEPVSTFASSVDTTSYSNIRRFLMANHILPPPEAVRVEELVNYFSYAYPSAETLEEPFKPTVNVYPSPWHEGSEIIRIGIKGYTPPLSQLPKLNIVLLMDVSGSMAPPDRLPLLVKAYTEMADMLRPSDRVSIVTYASGTKLVLEPTSDKKAIKEALAGLVAHGGTYGVGGLALAYEQAAKNFDPEATNRIILGTDGDFNIGMTDPTTLTDFIKSKRSLGIYLSVLGVGRGNFNDHLAQKLAQAGKGNAAYVDSLIEAQRVLLERMSSTLGALADDVKFQVEFNPAAVAEYRLIGFETRALREEDFRNDAIPGGDIGPGHAVTALYEITMANSPTRRTEPSRYRRERVPETDAHGNELAFLRIRYKLPGRTDGSSLIERPITLDDRVSEIDKAPADARFATAVAGFAQLLRRDPSVSGWRFEDAASMAEDSLGRNPDDRRREFVGLVRQAQRLRDLQ